MCESNAGTGTARRTVQVENDRTRVTEWRFPRRGDNTGRHRHAHDYVVVPLFDGDLEIVDASGGRSVATLRRGVSYFREAGAEHDVLSANDFECAFVEIEMLRPA